MSETKELSMTKETWAEVWEILISLRQRKQWLQASAPRKTHQWDRTGLNYVNRGVTAAKKELIASAKHAQTKHVNGVIRYFGEPGILRMVDKPNTLEYATEYLAEREADLSWRPVNIIIGDGELS